MKTTNRNAGFTLAELLLVMALMGVITTWAGVSFYKVTDTWKQVRGRSELEFQANKVFEAMRQDFSNVLPSRLSGATLQGIVNAEAGGSAVVAPVLVKVGSPERLAGIAVMYSLDPAQHHLVRTVGGLAETKPKGSPEVVAEDVSDLRIEYAGNNGEWAPTWSGNALPTAVRVSAVLSKPEQPEQAICRKAVFSIHVQ